MKKSMVFYIVSKYHPLGINHNEENSNFMVEKSGRHYF